MAGILLFPSAAILSQLVIYQTLLYQQFSGLFKCFQPEQCDTAFEETTMLFTDLLKLHCFLKGSFFVRTRTSPVWHTFASTLEARQNTSLSRPNGGQ